MVKLFAFAVLTLASWFHLAGQIRAPCATLAAFVLTALIGLAVSSGKEDS